MLDLEKLEKEKKEKNRTWCVLREQMKKEKDTFILHSNTEVN